MLNTAAIIANNQILQTMLGVASAGIITFFVRDLWLRLFDFIKRECSTSVVITSSNKIFHKIFSYLSDLPDTSFRTYKVTNGRWGQEAQHIFSLGYGTHLFKYRNRFLMAKLNKEGSNQTEYDKDTLILTTLGRNEQILNLFIQDSGETKLSSDKIELYKYRDGWSFIRTIDKRSLDTVFINEEIKLECSALLNSFIDGADNYKKRGIPYQLGLLLYGPPGTGKSSFIRALASSVNYPIYYLPVSSISSLSQAVGSLPNNVMLVIEDIDTNNVVHDRSDDENETRQFARVSLSEILNSLDGLLAPSGRILIATTNHIEDLDPALIRPGRIDRKIEIGYSTPENAASFVKIFYGGDATFNRIRSNLTIATLQRMYLSGATIDDIIDYCSVNRPLITEDELYAK